MTSRIILICYRDEKSNRLKVSHGYNTATNETVILPQEPVEKFKDAEYDIKIGEWVIIE